MAIESPSQLRAICQSGKESDPGWYFAHRRLSIYVTWLLLHTPIRPNQVTGLMMVLGVAGAALLALPAGAANAGGFVVLYLAFLLDKVDGEIARYRGASSMRGLMLDRLHHLLVEPMVFVAAAWHEYARSGSVGVWTAGWVIVVLGNLVDEHQHLSPYILFKHLRTARERPVPGTRPVPLGLARAVRWFKPLKGFRMFIVAVPALALAYAAQAWGGWPAVRVFLYAAVIGLAVLLVFQAFYYLTFKLEAEAGEQASYLSASPAPKTTAHERPAEPMRAVRGQ